MLTSPLAPLLMLVGVYILIKIKCFYILHPIKAFGRAASALKCRKNLTAFTLALAGTLGVGNLLGVAVGIMVGGAGSLFWLFVSAIPASAIKYAEVLVSSENGGGGIPDAARRSFPRIGKPMSAIYALACFLLSFVMGAALQSRSVVDSTVLTLGADRRAAAVILTLLVAVSVVGKGKHIGKITLFVIPLTTIIYIIVAISTVAVNVSALPSVLARVISEAFTPEAGVGGVLGLLTSRAVREGFSRGMLSNEAGAGTSSIGHTTGAAMPPAVRGLFGVLEVVFDTSVLCTLSGLAILVGLPEGAAASCGMELILSAVGQSLGAFPASLVTLSVWAFAYSTIVCWYYYGTECFRRLVGRGCTAAVLPLFLAFVIFGSVISESVLIILADALLLVLSAITLPTLIKKSDRIVLLSESCGFLKSKESDAGEGLDSEG